jgi:hypothetical protein
MDNPQELKKAILKILAEKGDYTTILKHLDTDAKEEKGNRTMKLIEPISAFADMLTENSKGAFMEDLNSRLDGTAKKALEKLSQEISDAKNTLQNELQSLLSTTKEEMVAEHLARYQEAEQTLSDKMMSLAVEVATAKADEIFPQLVAQARLTEEEIEDIIEASALSVESQISDIIGEYIAEHKVSVEQIAGFSEAVKKLLPEERQVTWESIANKPNISQGGTNYNQVKQMIDTALASFTGGSSTFLDLTDTPSSYTGNAGKFPKVNAGEDGLEFVAIPGGGDMLTSVYDPAGVEEQLVGLTAEQTVSNKTFEATQYNQYDPLYTETGSEPVGSVFWDSIHSTLNLKLNSGVKLQFGQELYFYGKASGAIANGRLCMFAGVEGDHILIKQITAGDVATIKANPTYVVGVATQAIANGEYGFITWFGKLNDVYTKATNNGTASENWVAGDKLYFDNTTGNLTNVEPEAPDTRIEVAVVIKAQTGGAENGIILVRPTFGMSLAMLDDVDGDDPTTTGDLLTYNATSGVWERGVYNIENYQLILSEGAFEDGDKNKLDGIADNANNYTHPNHTGDVTSSGDGETTITNGAVTNAKLANMAESTIKGRASGSGTGAPVDLTPTQARTILNVAYGATANSSDATLLNRANHTGTQAISTVSGLQDALDSKVNTTLSLPATNNTATSMTSAFNAGATLAIGECLYLGSSGKWLKADNDASATAEGLLAIALEAKNDTEAIKVALAGSFVRHDSWSWTVGGAIYLSDTAGALTQTIPTKVTDRVVRIVGYAVTSTVVYFAPQGGVIYE